MTKQSFIRRNWKLILNIVTLVALLGLMFNIRDQLTLTLHNLFKVNAWILLLMIPLQFLNYDAQTRLYRGLFRIVGNALNYKELFRSSLELNFVNHIFPSAGVTGISYFGLRMKGAQLSAPKATAVHLLKLVLLVVSFEVLIVIGVFALAVEGKMNSLVLLLAASLTTLMVVGTVGFGFIVGSKKRIAGFLTYVTKLLNRIIQLVRKHQPETINTQRVRDLFEDLHDNYVLMQSDLKRLRRPFLWAFLANFWEVASIYVVYLAFGTWVNVGAVILAYAVANIAGFVSIVPGGVGIYEALMTLTLTMLGVPASISLSVTIMYRVLNTAIQVPPGYVLYHQTLHSRKPVEIATGGQSG